MNTLNPQTLQIIMPYLAGCSLFICVFLWVVHAIRLYCNESWCWPKKWQNKEECNDAELSREMIRHENEIMNHRLMWFLTAEGLLLTALGFSFSKENAEVAKNFIPVLSFVGIILGASVSIVLDSASAAIVRWAPPHFKKNPSGDVIGYRGLPLFGLLAPWRIYPPMFIIAWYIISQMRI